MMLKVFQAPVAVCRVEEEEGEDINEIWSHNIYSFATIQHMTKN